MSSEMTTSPPPAVIAEQVTAAWARYLARDARRSSPHRYVWASSWRVCDRRMAYEMTQPGTLPPWPPELLARFRRGNDRERDILGDLVRIGRDAEPPFTVIGQQERFELKDHKGRVAISGKVDARLQFDRQCPPLEVKAWSPFLVDRIQTFADLFDNPWTIGGAHQLLAYLYGAGEPFGFLLLDRSGLPLLLPVELEAHLDRMEAFLMKAERVIDHVEAGTLPDFLPDDPAECRRCAWYGHTCNPPLTANAATVLTDPELEAQLERREQLQAAGREYLDLDRTIKDRLRGIESGIIGKFQVTGTWGKQSRVDLPADLKRQYTVTDPKGRFTLEITKVVA
jgi:hypothetical protein